MDKDIHRKAAADSFIAWSSPLNMYKGLSLLIHAGVVRSPTVGRLICWLRSQYVGWYIVTRSVISNVWSFDCRSVGHSGDLPVVRRTAVLCSDSTITSRVNHCQLLHFLMYKNNVVVVVVSLIWKQNSDSKLKLLQCKHFVLSLTGAIAQAPSFIRNKCFVVFSSFLLLFKKLSILISKFRQNFRTTECR